MTDKEKAKPRKVGKHSAQAAPYGPVTVSGIIVRDADAAREQIKRLQEQFDLLDEAAMYRDLIDKMEERHGEDFNAFLNALVMRFLMSTGLPSVTFSLSDLLQQVAGQNTTGHYLDIIEAPGKLTYVLRQEGDVLHTDLNGNAESVPAKPKKTVKVGWLDDCPLCKHDVADVVTAGDIKYLESGDAASCERCGLKGVIEVDDNSAFVAWDDQL